MVTSHLDDNRSAIAGMLTELRQVFGSGRTASLNWRCDQLHGIELLCKDNEPEIAAALANDLDRSATEAWLGDIASTAAEAVYARRNLKNWVKPQRQGLPLAQRPGRAWVQYDPVGVALIIGPWNYPFYLNLAPLVGAAAAGNCAVVKPSELAPASSALLARLLPQYLDHDAFRVVEGDAQTTQSLLAQGFDHAFFTGGTEVGKKIMTAAASTLTPVTLELGGKSPAIITADADLDVAARRIAAAKLANSGQMCIAPDYVLAERSIFDQFVAKLVATIATFRSGNADPSLRIVNSTHFNRLTAMLKDTRGRITHGGGYDVDRMRIEPTVIIGPPADDVVMADEIFGPILPVLAIESPDGAVEFVNARPKPLALYVFTASSTRARSLINRIPSGGAVINHVAMHCLVPQLPFGGVGASGMGAYHGRWGFEAFSHRRAVLAKRTRPDPKLAYPPYTERALKIMRRVF
ncbi:aldehyde dehydrogenase family protein [Mycolicibacterium moriokaense]|uniref:Aldehyde dehydrogenase n=1 Tax=Mycolicibacterium moriokaense TaxID=39691 RepID=A0A318H9M2_9MYCO|nr:aldehyde dehydrogenase family protein [Mycolicibacterium moriokaense]PXX03290.1 aldehyde dehydrogenase (NAD+) [Mycolicibacterium moriokaense]